MIYIRFEYSSQDASLDAKILSERIAHLEAALLAQRLNQTEAWVRVAEELGAHKRADEVVRNHTP